MRTMVVLLCLQASSVAAAAVDASAGHMVHLEMPRSMHPTAAAAEDARIVLPVLFDFQPALVPLNNGQSIAVQLRRFCVHHGLDSGRCGAILQQAMDELIELHGATYCRRLSQDTQTALLHVKNVLLPPSPHALKPPTYGWLHDEAANLASDLCGFLRSATSHEHVDADTSHCERPLQEAFDGSFRWINALPQCEPDTGNTLKEADSSDRVFTIEQVIASLRSRVNHTTPEATTNTGPIMSSVSASQLKSVVSTEPETENVSINSSPADWGLNNSIFSTAIYAQGTQVLSLAGDVSQPLIKMTTSIGLHQCLSDSEIVSLQLTRSLICVKSEAADAESTSELDSSTVATLREHEESANASEMSATDTVSVFSQANESEQQFRCNGDCSTRGNEANDVTSAEDASPDQNEAASTDVASTLYDPDPAQSTCKDSSNAMTARDLPEFTQRTDAAAETPVNGLGD